MLYVRSLLLASAIALGGCTTPPEKRDTPAQDTEALGERITRICALPEPTRTQEIEKLKKESGMVLYCGK